MPRSLIEAAMREHRQAWLATVPETVHNLAQRWSLEVGAPFQPGGQTAWVAPAYTNTGAELVLKIAWRHTEAAHEAAGLAVWDGQGTVRLYAVDESDDTVALLIERCVPGTALAGRPEPEQDVVIAALLSRLWREPAPDHPFRPLKTMCDLWADHFERKAATQSSSLDPGLARAGIELLRILPQTADRNVLLCTDLHADNVLAAQREPWLVIDPKPYVGDPTYDPLQHMLNCEHRLHTDPQGLVVRMAELLDLEPERLLLWLFARCVEESLDWPTHADVACRIAPR